LYPARFVNVVPSVFCVGATQDRRAVRTITAVIATALPFGPVQLRLYVVSCESGPTDALPEVDLVPLQPPDAVQLVTLVLDHVSVDVPLSATADGLAVNVTDGAAVTVTVADAEPDPPVPVQAKLYVAFAVNAPVDCEPEVAFVPDHPPLAVHDVAFVLDHVSVDDPPEVIDVGDAESVTVG
jgi:hypothetical protein